MTSDFTLPAMLPAKARALGEAGESWLSGLPDLVRDVAMQWGLSDLTTLEGGTEAFVASVRRADGTDAVLKVGLPLGAFGAEVDTLLRARGNGYVRVLRHDLDIGAVLLERLGRSLDRTGRAPDDQIATLCRLLPSAWAVPRPAGGDPTVDKARSLASYIEDAWARLGGPCTAVVRDEALACGERRSRALREERCVVVHGDAAAANALELLTPRPGAGLGFVFVDPDGFVGDPAYDVGVALRDWCSELMGDGDPRPLLQQWCRLAADLSGCDPDEVWEWAFMERVSTGLYCLELGATDFGRPFLDTATLLLG